jgi:hypothetical protein
LSSFIAEASPFLSKSTSGPDLGDSEIELDVGDTLMSLEHRRQPRACEYLAHRRVARERLRHESVEPLGAGVLGKDAKQDRSKAMTLELVSDYKSNLGALPIVQPFVAPDGDEAPAVHENEGHPLAPIDRDECTRFGDRQVRMDAEEPIVNAFLREMLVKQDQGIEVLFCNWPKR